MSSVIQSRVPGRARGGGNVFSEARAVELSPQGTAAPCCPKGESSARLCFPPCMCLDTCELWKHLWKNICAPGEKIKSELLCFQVEKSLMCSSGG